MDEAANQPLPPDPAPRDYISQHPKKLAWLEAFGRSGLIATACRMSGIGRWNVYKWLDKAGPDGDVFRADFETARQNAADFLRSEVIKRAVQGYDEPIIYKGRLVVDAQGQPVMRKRFSTTLLIYATNLALGINQRGEKVRNEPETADEALRRSSPGDVLEIMLRSMGLGGNGQPPPALPHEGNGHGNGDGLNGNGHDPAGQ